jgi:hypothetical protein
MKRNWRTVVYAVLCAAIITTTANAAVVATPSSSASINNQAEQITPYAEETTWYLRIHNGILQKRLWSNTRGIWLTDWIDCGWVEE